MAVNLQVPELGESITSVQIGAWRKSEGDVVTADEVVVELETDKAAVELPAPVGGTLVRIVMPQGTVAAVGDVIGVIDEQGATASAPSPSKAASGARAPVHRAGDQTRRRLPPQPHRRGGCRRRPDAPGARRVSPAPAATGAGPADSVPKADPAPAVEPEQATPAQPPVPSPTPAASEHREEERVPMTHLRKVIAGNLVAAQQAAALLTTFNEIDMTAVNELRARYKDAFLERHGIKLGFMSFFVKAAVDALQTVPAVNARIDGTTSSTASTRTSESPSAAGADCSCPCCGTPSR